MFDYSKTYNTIGAQEWVIIPEHERATVAAALNGSGTYSIETQLVANGAASNPPEVTGLTASLPPRPLNGFVRAVRVNIASLTGTLTFDVHSDRH